MADFTYPPEVHLLADLRVEIEALDDGELLARLPVTPELLAADGGVHAGMIATLVDIVGGAIAVRAVHPDWMATSDMALQVVRPAVGPVLEARGTVLRRGRTTLVIEVTVFDLPDDATPVAWSVLTFAVLPRAADGPPPMELPPVPRHSRFGPGELGAHVVDAVSIGAGGDGPVSMPIDDYVRNTIGALQGGVVALLAEVAAARAVAAALDAPAAATVDLQITYLATGRIGPVEARIRSVDADPATGSGRGLVELVDTGAGDRLTARVTFSAVAA